MGCVEGTSGRRLIFGKFR